MRGQPVSPGNATPTAEPSAPSSPAPPTNPAPVVLGIIAALILATLVLGLRRGNGRLYQRPAGLVGGLIGFGAGVGYCAGSAFRLRPEALGFALFIGVISSLPGFAAGYFMGKKEPHS